MILGKVLVPLYVNRLLRSDTCCKSSLLLKYEIDGVLLDLISGAVARFPKVREGLNMCALAVTFELEDLAMCWEPSCSCTVRPQDHRFLGRMFLVKFWALYDSRIITLRWAP